jgi:hypothetical protein
VAEHDPLIENEQNILLCLEGQGVGFHTAGGSLLIPREQMILGSRAWTLCLPSPLASHGRTGRLISLNSGVGIILDPRPSVRIGLAAVKGGRRWCGLGESTN